MPRFLPSLLASAVAAVLAIPIAGLAQTPAPQSSPGVVFPAGVELVTVDVIVLDAHGEPVEGLRREDFLVKEDGRPQTIASFEAVSLTESPPAATAARTRVYVNTIPGAASRSFVIVFDEMNLTPRTVEAARRAVDQFLGSGVRAGDVVTVVPTGGGAWWTEPIPEGRAALTEFLTHLDAKYRPDTSVARISDYEAVQIHYGRDSMVMSQILRRYYENGVIQEFQDPGSAAELAIAPGAPIVRARADAVYQSYAQRMKSTLGTLARVAEALRGAKGRKTVLFVSEGFALDTTQAGFREVVRAARDANAAFYFVDARGLLGAAGAPGAPGAGADEGRAVLEQDTLATLSDAAQESAGAESVALDTGGYSIRNTNDLAGQMRALSRESRAYYLLGYAPAEARRDGKFRRIEVEVGRPDLKVRARRGYYAPSEKGGAARGRDDVDPVVRAGLDAPLDVAGIPLRLAAYGLGPVAPGKSAAVVAAEVDLAALDLRRQADKRWTGVLESYTVVASRHTRQTFPQENIVDLAVPDDAYAPLRATGISIFREFQLPPGEYQVRFLVRDRQSGRVGSVRGDFGVPDPSVLGTSTPILTDRLQPTVPQGGSRPVPIAHRSFKTGSRLYCAFEVYGAGRDATGAPRLSSSYVVKRPDGSLLTRMEPRPMQASPRGQVSQMLSLSLADAPPGAYQLVLTVRDDLAGRSVEVSEPFTVEG
jgi:VWFA-related protein